jgi:hypothetical protein
MHQHGSAPVGTSAPPVCDRRNANAHDLQTVKLETTVVKILYLWLATPLHTICHECH